MLFWFLAIAVTAIACAALFYAARPRMVNATEGEMHDPNSHFRLVLAGIDADIAAGKLADEEAAAAKAELAREILRAKGQRQAAAGIGELPRGALFGGLAAIAVVSLGIYGLLGNPELPSQPLAGRPDVAAQTVDIDDAIARIEAALTSDPDDLRGWTVIAPAYMELGRYADAANAYRRVIALSEATPDLQTSLAEALIFAGNGVAPPEALELLRTAAANDPRHVMSRLYIGAELTRQGDYGGAASAWREAIALSTGDEPWLAAAQQGLAVAENNGIDPAQAQQTEMIGQMVSGLATRLAEQGGSVEEWTQLVRAYLVLGDTAKAQASYDEAVVAYPQAFDRGGLDSLALEAGLVLNGATP